MTYVPTLQCWFSLDHCPANRMWYGFSLFTYPNARLNLKSIMQKSQSQTWAYSFSKFLRHFHTFFFLFFAKKYLFELQSSRSCVGASSAISAGADSSRRGRRASSWCTQTGRSKFGNCPPFLEVLWHRYGVTEHLTFDICLLTSN